MVKIDLEGTELLDRAFMPIEEGTGSDGHPEQERWKACFVRDQQWHGAGDGSQLEKLLDVFLDWADSH
jgi:hypothetical protein